MTERATFRLKTGLAEMLKGGVIMDVVTPEEAKIAEVRDTPLFTLLETPEAPVDRDFPNRRKMPFIGALFGAALAAAWIAFRSTGWSARALDPVGYDQLANAFRRGRRNRDGSAA